MSALVTLRGQFPNVRHYAHCVACVWTSDEYPENIAAYRDCRTHNAALHDFEDFQLSVPAGPQPHSKEQGA